MAVLCKELEKGIPFKCYFMIVNVRKAQIQWGLGVAPSITFCSDYWSPLHITSLKQMLFWELSSFQHSRHSGLGNQKSLLALRALTCQQGIKSKKGEVWAGMHCMCTYG